MKIFPNFTCFSGQVAILFLKRVFGWSDSTAGFLIAAGKGGRALCVLLVLPVLIHIWPKPQDLFVIRLTQVMVRPHLWRKDTCSVPILLIRYSNSFSYHHSWSGGDNGHLGGMYGGA